MKYKFTYIIAFSFIALCALASFSTMAQETSADFSGGSVKVGFDNRTCDSSNAGAIRYNSSSSKIELCDGSNWLAFTP